MGNLDQELENEIRLELLDNLNQLFDGFTTHRGNWLVGDHLDFNLRVIHSAKGNANAGGFNQYINVLHGFEDIFFNLRDKQMGLSAEHEDLILDFVGDLIRLVEGEIKTNTIAVEAAELPSRLESTYSKIFNADEMELPSPFSVLLVDDNADFLEVFHETLEIEFPDWEFTKAEDGNIALDIAKKREFDLIVTDYYMPEMNGNEFIKGTRLDSQNLETPIVMVTAFKPEFDNDQSLWENVFFLEKPINWKKLKFIVKCMGKTNKAS